jgi:hypothetical protein
LLLVGFNGVENDAFPLILHGTTKEDKEEELIFRGFKSSFPLDIEDVEVSPLHIIFDLKGVLVGKEYFKVNHLLPSLFNLVRGPTLLGNNIVPKLILKEFLFRCLEEFTIYIWTYIPLAKMHAYLKKIVEDTNIEIDLQRIMG